MLSRWVQGPAIFALGLLLIGCSRGRVLPRIVTPDLAARSAVPSPDAEACAACHPQEVEAWRASQHAHANRLVDPAVDDLRFAFALTTEHAAYTTTMRKERNGGLTFAAEGPDGRATYRAEAVIGVSPLVQYLVPFPGGRLQAVDAAYDTVSNAWFYAFGDERTPEDWGHWKNRALTWNGQCAYCHMTGFEKRYDPATDRYASTWQAMGISCAQCHVISNQSVVVGNQCPMVVPAHLESQGSYLDSCASCHARREELTGMFKPGDRFDDHYRLMLADSTLFHPDGQVNDEDFEYGSFTMSRMRLKGVVCMDCHDPHSARLKVPLEDNALCLQCHGSPGQRGAIPIDVIAHTHHALTNAGSLCVNCHMPRNTYMVRDHRRDHGFTSPDPLLTKTLGIPNACATCHQDKTVDWQIEWVDTWYGTNMERRSRSRAFAIAKARRGEPDAVTNLQQLADTEEIDAWRAALTSLLAPWSYRADVRAALEQRLRDTSALVRDAAVRGLQGLPGAHDLLLPLRNDPTRLVRIDATRATLNQMERDTASYGELKTYLEATCDQPAGAMRMAQFDMAEGRMSEAETWARKAVAWDPSSGATHDFLGQLLHAMGKSADAEASLREACRIEPNEASHTYALALVVAESGRTREAQALLERTVALDPRFGRAWYNLGLARARMNELQPAADALAQAEQLLPDSADPPYALATVYARQRRIEEARAACHRALKAAPDFDDARALLRVLSAAPTN